MKYTIKIESVDGRLRAVMKDEKGYEIGRWWLTDASGTRRYKPLKPAPPQVHFILNRLSIRDLEQIVYWLYTADIGDELTIEI